MPSIDQQTRPATLAIVAALGAVYLFWGGTFLAIRYAVADIPPLLMMAFRCTGGAAVLSLWLLWRRPVASPLRASAREWRTAAMAGALLFLGCHGLLAWAQQRVTSGQAALVMTAIPLFMVLLSSLHLRSAPSTRVLLGLALGTTGVATLVGTGVWSARPLDLAALIASAFAWALGSLVGRSGPRASSSVLTTVMQLTAGAVWLLMVSAATGEMTGWSPADVSARAILSLAFLILCGTALAFAGYTWLLTVTTPAVATSYAFVNPVVALTLAWAVGDEVFSGRTVVAAVLVLAAIALTRERSSRKVVRHGPPSEPAFAPELRPSVREGTGGA